MRMDSSRAWGIGFRAVRGRRQYLPRLVGVWCQFERNDDAIAGVVLLQEVWHGTGRCEGARDASMFVLNMKVVEEEVDPVGNLVAWKRNLSSSGGG